MNNQIIAFWQLIKGKNGQKIFIGGVFVTVSWSGNLKRLQEEIFK
jgi:hypothetical protein